MSNTTISHSLTTLKDGALFHSVLRALTPYVKNGCVQPGVYALIVPAAADVIDYDEAVEAIGAAASTDAPTSSFKHIVIKGRLERDNLIKHLIEAVTQSRVGVVVTADLEHLPDNVLLTVDHVVPVPPVTARDLVACFADIFDLSLNLKQAEDLMAYRLEAISAAFRPGRSYQLALERLRSIPTASAAPKPTGFEITTLDQMSGYGAAQSWGLQLAKDLADWKDGKIDWAEVDKGLLLSGPPGCGKTIFAASLAKTCQVELIATSAAQWQAVGHLGEHLKAMRRSFSSARAAAPAILFIDEIDSVGDRQTFGHDNKSYSIQVVNGLLECMDGLGGREGVVVIGATNFPASLDAALTRPGRLDHHIAIPLPDAAARAKILGQHLGVNVSLTDVVDFGPRTSGMSGADLAQLARNAKRCARVDRRLVHAGDIEASLPPIMPVSGEFRRAIAYHEAGHTVVGVCLGYGQLLDVSIASNLHGGAAIQQMGGARFINTSNLYRDRQFYMNQICTLLAGMAAEKLALATFCDGSAMGDDSDLARATLIATMLEASLGMGETLVKIDAADDREWNLIRRVDPSLSRRVDHTLKQQLARATAILEDECLLLRSLANLLDDTGLVTGEEVLKLRDKIQRSRNRKRKKASNSHC